MTNNFEDDNDDLELIEKYYKGRLAGSELDEFIRREKSDKSFAEKVKSYTEIMSGIDYYGEQQEFADTIKGWENEIKEISKKKSISGSVDPPLKSDGKVIPINRSNMYWLGAAAASVLIVIAFLTFRNEEPEQLASAYIEENFTTLPTTMGNGTNNLTAGIGAYNEKEYLEAEQLFRSLSDNEDLAAESSKYLGITYLRTGQYDKAIEQFNKLTEHENLYANPGKFYLAIALMKRSDEGDEVEAKKLLQEVVAKELPGYKEAADWLEHL